MKVLAVIHARGGSVRIPLKNIANLNGKPLIYYMIKAALDAETVDRVIVSTDSDDIAEKAREAGAEIPFKRPAELAEDVPSEFVTQHAVKFLEDEGYKADIILTLQPTSPFCQAQDIDACVNKLKEIKADSVVSVCEVEEHPIWNWKIEGNSLTPFFERKKDGEIGVSQNLPKTYIPNGAIHATTYDTLMKYSSVYGKKVSWVVMPRERSLDIDTPFSLEIARSIMEKGLISNKPPVTKEEGLK